jgi:hypothetical protein
VRPVAVGRRAAKSDAETKHGNGAKNEKERPRRTAVWRQFDFARIIQAGEWTIGHAATPKSNRSSFQLEEGKSKS